MRKTKRYNLDFFKTISYFVDHISCEKTLSKKIIQNTDFTHGTFFTILPVNSDIKRKYDFACGGIIPVLENKDSNMDEECSKKISSIIKQRHSQCIVENYMFSPDSPYVKIENVKMIPFNNEVYYFLDTKNSRIEINQAIKKSNEVWHFIAVMTHIKELPKKLTEDFFDIICKKNTLIIAGAYDGEGYIFWEKNLKKPKTRKTKSIPKKKSRHSLPKSKESRLETV